MLKLAVSTGAFCCSVLKLAVSTGADGHDIVGIVGVVLLVLAGSLAGVLLLLPTGRRALAGGVLVDEMFIDC